MDELSAEHIPVLSKVLAEQITLPQDAVMVDATLGHGGHSWLFGQNLSSKGVIVGFDVDEKSIEKAKSHLAPLKCKLITCNSNFSDMVDQLDLIGIEKVDFILADLGFCSAQLNDREKGLSFLQDMPLDMRIDKRLMTSAADIVNETDEKSLADLIFQFGQDRASRRIARFIVQNRQEKPITTTKQLAAIVARALSRPGKKKWSRIHPATRTFQALRIVVNDELASLETLLEAAPGLLNKDGQIAIISFHSLEDRVVKFNFKDNKKEGIYEIITKKPLVPDEQEIEENRRSRSSKLRIARRL